jgi:hypothetical protein
MKGFAKPPFIKAPMIGGKDDKMLIEYNLSAVLLNPPYQFRIFVAGKRGIESAGGKKRLLLYNHIRSGCGRNSEPVGEPLPA